MRFHFGTVVALVATVTAQTTKPKISAAELVESISVLTEAVKDVVDMTGDIPSKAEAINVGVVMDA